LPIRNFSEADISRWAAEGLISPEQAKAILSAEEAREAAGAGQREVAEGLNLPTVLYYLGASLAMIGLFVFASLNWEDVGRDGRVPIVAAGMAALLGSGHYVRTRTPYARGGGVLFALGVGMVPLLYLAFADALVGDEETIFSGEMMGEAVLIQALSLATMVVILGWSRLPLISLAVAGQSIALAATGGILWLGSDAATGIMVIVTGAGAVLLLVGLGCRFRGLAEHRFWFSLSGHGAFFYGFTYVAMSEWGIGTALAYLATFGTFVVGSVVLGERPYLIAGVAGLYAFVFRLIFDTFEGSPFLPLAIALVGVSMVALAIMYQRYRGELLQSLRGSH
jgi:hypothetical protein